MPSIKAVEALVEVAAESAAKILPFRLANVVESLSGKAGLNANAATQSGRGIEAGSAASEILGTLKITDQAASSAFLSPQRAEIVRANEVLVDHITRGMPQVQGGKLDWVLGGSTAVNALARTRSLTILDSAQLPAIVPAKVIQLSDTAVNSYGNFVRKVGDVDAFVVNGGENKFLNSQFMKAPEVALPDGASGALTAVGEARSSRLVQGVKMEFDYPEIAAIEYAGKTVFVTAPGQLMSNKMRQVLFSYAPADAAKLTGDFSHLLDAASGIYTEQALLQFGRQGLQRNGLLYRQEVLVPWDKTADNSKFVDYLRKVLESEERNGFYLKGLKIDSSESLTAMRLFEKHPKAGDKAALAAFINRHADFVRGLDVGGSAERARYLMQGGTGKASDRFMSMLESLPSN